MRLLILLSCIVFSSVSFAGISPICSVAGVARQQSENLMAALTRVPSPPFVVLEQEGKARFVSPSKMYASILDTSEHSIVINDLEELRFLSQTLSHSTILLVLAGKADWDLEKSRRVLSVAKLLDIKLSLLWLGEATSPKILRDMIVQSGGENFATSDLFYRVEKLCRESMASNQS